MNALDIAWSVLKIDRERFTPEEIDELSRRGGISRLEGTKGGLKSPIDFDWTQAHERDPNQQGELPLLEGREALEAEAALYPDPPESPTQDERYEEMGRGVEELIRPLQRQQRREQLASISDSEKRDLREQAIRDGMDRLWREHLRNSDWGQRERPPSDAHRQLFTPEAERAKPIIEDYIQSIRDEMGGAPSSQEIRDQMKNFRDYLMRGAYGDVITNPFYDEPGDESILDRLNEEGIHPGGIEHYLHQKHIRPHEVQEGQRARAVRVQQRKERKQKEREAQERFAREDPQARLMEQFRSEVEGSDEEQPAQKTVGVKSQRPPPPTRGQRRVGVQRKGDSNE